MLKLFGFIRNIFRSKAPEEQDDWDFSVSHARHVAAFDEAVFRRNQADLQMLRNILSRHIKAADQVRKEIKEEALEYEVGDDLRNILFGQHREVKAYLKKLAALQHRLKHKIAAEG